MTDDLETNDLSSPATNGASDGSASALSTQSGPTETVAGSDEKELSTAVKRFPLARADEKELSTAVKRFLVTAVDDKELSTAAKRFLIAEINRLVEENRQLKQFKEKYHDVDKKLVQLKEMIKPVRRNQFLSSACLIAGAAGVAAAPSVLTINQYGWYVFVSVSAMLLVAGIAARFERSPTGISSK